MQGKDVVGFADETRTPLWYGDAAACLHLLAGKAEDLVAAGNRLIHLAGTERLTRVQMLETMKLLAEERLGKQCSSTIVRKSRNDFPGEPRAEDLSLDTTLFQRIAGRSPCGTFEVSLKAALGHWLETQ